MDATTRSGISSFVAHPPEENTRNPEQQQQPQQHQRDHREDGEPMGLCQKRKKLLAQKAAVAKAEESIRQRSKSIFAQNIDGETNLEQSRRACGEITKLLERNAKGLQLIKTRLEAASAQIERGKKTIETTAKTSNVTIEALTARFRNLRIQAENEKDTLMEKLGQNGGAESVLDALRDGLKHLLGYCTLFEQRTEQMRQIRDECERQLVAERGDLLNSTRALRADLAIRESVNRNFCDETNSIEMELNKLRSAKIENVDAVVTEMSNLEQLLTACTEEYNDAAIELSKLTEEETDMTLEEWKYDEEIARLKAELDILQKEENDDPEAVSDHYKSMRKSLQAEMNEKVHTLQDEIKQAESELSTLENEYAPMAEFLGIDKHCDWSNEIENIIAENKRLEEAICAERKAIVGLRADGMKTDFAYNQLKLEIYAFRESSNAEMEQHKNENTDLRKYLDDLSSSKKQKALRYGIAGCRSVLPVATTGRDSDNQRLDTNKTEAAISRSTKEEQLFRKPSLPKTYSYVGDDGKVHSVWKGIVCDLDETIVPQPISEDDFKRGAASRPQWLNTIDAETGADYQAVVKEVVVERRIGSENIGRMPSEINTIRDGHSDGYIARVIGPDEKVHDYCYPLPPSPFGSPLTSDDSSRTATADCDLSCSEFDQSVWTDFSAVMK